MGMIEETDSLMLDWNKISSMAGENKVIPVAVQNILTKEVILIAYTNEEAFMETVRRKKLRYASLDSKAITSPIGDTSLNQPSPNSLFGPPIPQGS